MGEVKGERERENSIPLCDGCLDVWMAGSFASSWPPVLPAEGDQEVFGSQPGIAPHTEVLSLSHGAQGLLGGEVGGVEGAGCAEGVSCGHGDVVCLWIGVGHCAGGG